MGEPRSVGDQPPADLSVEGAGPRAVPRPAAALRPGTVEGPDQLLHPLQVLGAEAPVLGRSPAGTAAVGGPDTSLRRDDSPPLQRGLYAGSWGLSFWFLGAENGLQRKRYAWSVVVGAMGRFMRCSSVDRGARHLPHLPATRVG